MDTQLMNYPASDLGEVLSRKKSFQEALDTTTLIERKRMTTTGKAKWGSAS
jgi:hypothetical protein